MSHTAMVSTIIIFLNAEPFLQEAVESVLTQTYENWELLLVDDGSTDGSSAIARQYAARYAEKVHYLEFEGHINHGMSAARNLGIQHAGGSYVAFLDADDTWYPNTLEDQVAILEENPQAALVYGPIQYWYSWTGSSRDQQRNYIERLGVQPNCIIRPPELLPLFLQDKAAVPTGYLIRREAIAALGGFEEDFRGEYEDQVFCAKVCLFLPVFAADVCWYRYRQHPFSCVSMGQQTGQTASKRLIFLEWLERFAAERGVTDGQVWQAIRHELWPYRHRKLHQLGEYIGQVWKQLIWMLNIKRV